MEENQPKPHSEESITDNSITISPLTSEIDLTEVEAILSDGLVDPETNQPITDEIEETIANMRESLNGNERYYVVAQDGTGKVVGIMGTKLPDVTMSGVAQTSKPLEIVNAFVSRQARNSGIGQQLVMSLETYAKDTGFTEVVVNSGPRYQSTGWKFWDSMYGSPIATLTDYYGKGLNAPVWQKLL